MNVLSPARISHAPAGKKTRKPTKTSQPDSSPRSTSSCPGEAPVQETRRGSPPLLAQGLSQGGKRHIFLLSFSVFRAFDVRLKSQEQPVNKDSFPFCLPSMARHYNTLCLSFPICKSGTTVECNSQHVGGLNDAWAGRQSLSSQASPSHLSLGTALAGL